MVDRRRGDYEIMQTTRTEEIVKSGGTGETS
jgi:hypothetical protein